METIKRVINPTEIKSIWHAEAEGDGYNLKWVQVGDGYNLPEDFTPENYEFFPCGGYDSGPYIAMRLSDMGPLTKPLPSNEPKQVFYDAEMDRLHYVSVDEAVVAEWINPSFTVFRSAIDERVIGFEFFGIRAAMEDS